MHRLRREDRQGDPGPLRLTARGHLLVLSLPSAPPRRAQTRGGARICSRFTADLSPLGAYGPRGERRARGGDLKIARWNVGILNLLFDTPAKPSDRARWAGRYDV